MDLFIFFRLLTKVLGRSTVKISFFYFLSNTTSYFIHHLSNMHIFFLFNLMFFYFNPPKD